MLVWLEKKPYSYKNVYKNIFLQFVNMVIWRLHACIHWLTERAQLKYMLKVHDTKMTVMKMCQPILHIHNHFLVNIHISYNLRIKKKK